MNIKKHMSNEEEFSRHLVYYASEDKKGVMAMAFYGMLDYYEYTLGIVESKESLRIMIELAVRHGVTYGKTLYPHMDIEFFEPIDAFEASIITLL